MTLDLDKKLCQFEERFSGACVRAKKLAPLTYYKLGGPAELFVETSSSEKLLELLSLVKELRIPFWVLGSASNLLISDKGLSGVVAYMANEDQSTIRVLEEDADNVYINVKASCAKATLLDYAITNSLSGLEFSAGIPGSLGGAVAMNAGTKWGNYAAIIDSVEFCHVDKGIFDLTRDEIGFQYRGLGEGVLDGQTIVLSLNIVLKKEKDNREIMSQVNEILSYRGFKQPLELPNCGSVFKNPETGPGAGRLIEACGLMGKVIGGARISTKHANFIQNTGNAKSADIKALINHIQAVVLKEKSVQLEPEVKMLGFE